MYDLSYEIEHLIVDDESRSNNTVIILDNAFYCISDYLGICNREHSTFVCNRLSYFQTICRCF